MGKAGRKRQQPVCWARPIRTKLKEIKRTISTIQSYSSAKMVNDLLHHQPANKDCLCLSGHCVYATVST